MQVGKKIFQTQIEYDWSRNPQLLQNSEIYFRQLVYQITWMAKHPSHYNFGEKWVLQDRKFTVLCFQLQMKMYIVPFIKRRKQKHAESLSDGTLANSLRQRYMLLKLPPFLLILYNQHFPGRHPLRRSAWIHTE